MVWTVLAQFKDRQKHDRHARYWAPMWNPILNNYLDVEQRWKNTSLFVWSEEVFKFEDVLQDMLAGQVGLTRIKCFWGVSFKVWCTMPVYVHVLIHVYVWIEVVWLLYKLLKFVIFFFHFVVVFAFYKMWRLHFGCGLYWILWFQVNPMWPGHIFMSQ